MDGFGWDGLFTQIDQDFLKSANHDKLVRADWDLNPEATTSPIFTTAANMINGHDGNSIKATGPCLTSSLESLDCLLSASATNSNTDTSVDQDDGISMIFSDCRCLLTSVDPDKNFSVLNANNSNAAISSGESENNFSLPWMPREIDQETISQHSNPDKVSSCSKPVSCKRSNSQIYEYPTNQQGGFRLIMDTNNANSPKPKKPRSEKRPPSSSNINFQQETTSTNDQEPDAEAIAQMKEMIYRAAAFRPVNLGIEVVDKPKRKNVRISTDPQTVAARQRRERISERIRVLQRLVPGGSKMDTASMLDEACNYLKFLRSQVKALENISHKLDNSIPTTNIAFSNSLPFNFSSSANFPVQLPNFPLQNPTQAHNLPQCQW